MATIKPIEGRTVHQIQSGQVIVDLCSVVKELVENSLDAGATTLEVRFKNNGLDSIEVQDNGDGISPNNYESLALKHHTSKLSTYSDLTTLQTFGFRGEALSSLCALSHFFVITCMASEAPKGTKLEFEVSGKLRGKSLVAAQKGTTVIVENLFNNLPVRRRELERNIKREWGRVIGILGQYACIQTGLKFSVTQQPAKGKRTTLFSTKGNQSTRENIVNVFGAKTLMALIPMDLKFELEPTSMPSQKQSAAEDESSKKIRIVGHISRPAFGEGRQTPDRQMFFVNTRPCALPQVAKAFNEVYKSYNTSQSPFIFANIDLDTHMYDVNVSPDKRTILLHDQTRMLDNLKVALTELFESQDYRVPITSMPVQKQPSYKQLTINRDKADTTDRSKSPGAEAEAATSDDSSESMGEEQSSDDEGSQKPNYEKFRHNAVTRKSLSPNLEEINLTANWTGRYTEDRADKKLSPRTPPHVGGKSLLAGKRKFVEKSGRESENDDISDYSEDPDSPVATTQESNIESLDTPPTPLPNFDRQSAEPPIPALLPPSLKPPNVTLNSRSIKPQKASAAIATITIGDHTLTSSIGAPQRKRARIENFPVPKTSMPSFGGRLSQRFAAPGTGHSEPSLEYNESESEEETASPELLDSCPTPSGEGAEVDEEPTKMSLSAADVNENLDFSPANAVADDDGEYIDEHEQKAHEEAKVQEMIQDAEEAAARPSQESAMRAKSLFKGGAVRKDSTVNIVGHLSTSISAIEEQIRTLNEALSTWGQTSAENSYDQPLDSSTAEEKLSLTIAKTDFAKMKIIGQFNLGFILASRASEPNSETEPAPSDDLFIIDQHASDEKYNFERLQATTIVQSQRLVYPKILNLTALEEEIAIENLSALETNGFVVSADQSGNVPVGQRCQLISLPLSRETAFSLTDLEELLVLLSEHPPGSVPRPSKVRKMFAMRACRSSIMIGRTLTHKQMSKVVKHMGEIDKPWNCPHGRPTMRHLCGLGVWDEIGWKEGDDPDGERAEMTDWASYVRRNRGNSVPSS